MDNLIKNNNKQLIQETLTFSASCSGGESINVSNTCNNISTVIGVVSIQGGAEYVWLKNISFSGNTVTCKIGNSRSSGGPQSGTYTVVVTGY